MSDLFWLSEARLRRIRPFFPLSHGIPHVDDRRLISGIIFVIRNGLRWRRPRMGHRRPCTSLCALEPPWSVRPHLRTHLKAHRTAASLRKKGLFPAVWPREGKAEIEAARVPRLGSWSNSVQR